LNAIRSFWWGLFGSILPEIVRIYKIVNSGESVSLSWQYFAISFVFMVAAGFFTVAWKPENEFKAIWVGVSFPVLVSAMIQAAPSLAK